MEDSKQSEALSLEQFKQIMDKLSRLDNQMQEHFGNLTSEISILRHEMKPRSEDASKSTPRPIIARFLSREDRDTVLRERETG